MRRPAISPHDPRVVLLGCDMTGAYITRDGGASWRMFNFGSVPTAFAFDPADPDVLYAGAQAVYRSADGGRTWRMVLPDPARHTTVRDEGDHGERVFYTEDPAYPGSGKSVTVHAIAVDPADPKRIYVAASAADSPVPGSPASPTQIIGSADAGRTWTHLADCRLRADLCLVGRRHQGEAPAARHRRGRRLGGRRRRVAALLSPGKRPIHVGRLRPRPPLGRDPRLCDAPRGRSPLRRNPGLRGRRAHVARAQRRPPRRGARHWKRPGVGARQLFATLPRPHRDLRPQSPCGLRGPARDRRSVTWAAPINGIAKTEDGGRTWTVVHEESDKPSANLLAVLDRGRGPEEDGHSVWFDAPYDLAVAPTRSRTSAFATDLFRTYRTLDGGEPGPR